MSEEMPSNPSAATRFLIVIAVFLVLAGAVAYSFHERSVAEQLGAQNSEMSSALNATRDQISALTTKLNAMNTEQTPEKSSPSHPVIYHKPVAAASQHRRIDDSRWKKMQSQLDDQGKQIESTRQDLSTTRTELQGSIATTHEELVLLEKKGERSYYEFDLEKSGQFQHEGPVGIRLRKANTKHAYADLELLVDDFKLSKKHVNVYEPVVFYSGDRRLPVELVINGISKNHIHGYISEPKYKSADLEAMASSPANNQPIGANGDQPVPSNAKPSPERRRLEHPKMD
jgi:uncharacterized coiled-coil protein SlyX